MTLGLTCGSSTGVPFLVEGVKEAFSSQQNSREAGVRLLRPKVSINPKP